jgi:hypothetical protein
MLPFAPNIRISLFARFSAHIQQIRSVIHARLSLSTKDEAKDEALALPVQPKLHDTKGTGSLHFFRA